VARDEPQVSVGGLLEQVILGKFGNCARADRVISQQRSRACRR
jgi:hypothetical protein